MEGYERRNALTWDLHYAERPEQPQSGGWKLVDVGRKRGAPCKQVPLKLTHESDNGAQAEWRDRKRPVDEVRIPDELALQRKPYYEEVAKRYCTFIFSQHHRSTSGTKTLGIWGEKNAVSATKKEIFDWIEESGFGNRKSASGLKFPKVVSLTPVLREREERRWEKRVTMEKFRQHPPPDKVFGAIGSFHWPVPEYKPADVLGTQFEALDPVRMDCSCHVVYHPERSIFRVLGKASDVKEGLLRIRKACFQIAAWQVMPIRLTLLYWPNPGKLPLFVYLEEYKTPLATTNDISKGPIVRRSPRAEGHDKNPKPADKAMRQTEASSATVRTAILKTLGKLHYFRGHLQMRVRLGRFLATQYRELKDTVWDLDEYEDMTQESQFIGEVTQEVGDVNTESALFDTILNSDGFLTPSEAILTNLKDVRPTYTAVFHFADHGGDIRLTVDWQQTLDTTRAHVEFDMTSKKWVRLDRDTGMLKPLLDASLTDLSTSLAWQLDVSASTQVVDECNLPEQLVSFAKNLRIEPKAVRHQDDAVLFVRRNPYAKLKSFRQQIGYQYAICDSDYTLEVCRYQDQTFAPHEPPVNEKMPPTIYEPRWSLNVFRKEWDTSFAKNERLPIGQGVDWSDDVTFWFPSDIGPGAPPVDEHNPYQGWDQLMDKLMRIHGIVAELMQEV
ncbi:hypothetical protein BAUCODRAFT_203034 [Baudoinia panamericana UAMH 10762]|uniref:DUF7905 domain-containing protein n=1 Tax=Baudoinia panamericana (strain UAMH 10762) TaxID=717646 RepID=M2NAH1_BAUPA|nr:uncharacterized protein BAUCODRAFT_203034 [Baudoinia panamericana UAMH 10762]EMD01224.1 hypothetical protein BAUCODRAFT_203034 [Baudoinia panamericana UAMH 10762]